MSFFSGGITVLLVFALWQAIVSLAFVPSYLLPGPVAIAESMWEHKWLLSSHTLATATIALIGFVVALVLATASAWLMQLVPLIRKIIYPWLVASQAIPVIFLFPLLLLWFGFGSFPHILVVALVCYFPIAINLSDAMQRCNPDLLLVLKSMGVSRGKLIRHVHFMAALPDYFSGLRIAATYCVTGAVIAEWLGATRGLGVYMLRAYKSFTPDRVFAAIVLIVLLTLLLVCLVRCAEHFFTPWKRKET